MNILVSGASGYVGSHLVPALLTREHSVFCMTREARKLSARFPRRVNIVEADALQPQTLGGIFRGIDVAYYLIHSLGRSGEAFRELDHTAACNFAKAAKEAGVKRIIFMGGLGDPTRELSIHLRSRHETSLALREYGPPLTEFRSAVIIGAGGISFEMIRYLTERLPLMICPSWVTTRIQPIGIDDVVRYLVAAPEVPDSAGETIDIGSPSIESYRSMMLKYAAHRGLRRLLLQVPVLTPRLSSYWVDLVTPIPSSISHPLIEGLRNEVVCRNDSAPRLFPNIQPVTYEKSLGLALEVPDLAKVVERRAAQQFAGPKPDSWRHRVTEDEGWVVDIREGRSKASMAQVFAVAEGIGGARGWYYGPRLWRLRAWMDRMLGGSGMGEGRRHPDTLELGDKLDFWEVDCLERGRLLRLRALMKVPGEAYLQFETFPEAGGGTRLRSTALFRPRGLMGRIYWWMLLPVHRLIFSGLNAAIRSRAESQSIMGTASTVSLAPGIVSTRTR